MGKKGKDRFDDIRKPRGAKKPVRKYTDQRMGHVRGYKDVDCSETSLQNRKQNSKRVLEYICGISNSVMQRNVQDANWSVLDI